MTETLNVGILYIGNALDAAKFAAKIERMLPEQGLRLVYVKKSRRSLTIFSPDEEEAA